MTTDLRTLLLLDDDEVFATRMARALGIRGFEVTRVATAAEALASVRADSPECALVDLRLPDGHGLDVVAELHAIDATTRIVVLTGYGAIATAVESLRRGASDYLTKPVDADQVASAFDPLAAPADHLREFTVPSLARVEWEHIQRVMTECQGNVSQAARLLGLHRRSLQRKLSKYPVNR
ncbi:MAG TPA: response regulator [Vicinamibacterales bacterium]|nr:response regulator [Vicinamibacterales bacterium]